MTIAHAAHTRSFVPARSQLLDALAAAGLLSSFDLAFAGLLQRLSCLEGADAEWVAYAAALASARCRQQDVLIDLARLAQDDPLELGVAAGYPDAAPILAALRASAVVDCEPDDAPTRPLVLVGTRLYLARQFVHEQTLGRALLARAMAPSKFEPEALEHVRESFDLLFPRAADGTVNWQRLAAAMALSRRLTVITGGPGTGKTTTVTRALVLIALLQPDVRIALAAPTGKAAARLGEAVRQAKALVGAALSHNAATALARVPEQGTTLHRLLGLRPLTNTFRFDATRQLPLDVLVIDEASMLDLRLARATLDALPASAQLLLVGDKDQLSSVDAGSVLGDLCAGLQTHFDAARFSPAAADALSAYSGEDVRALAAPDVPALADCLAWLRTSHRFREGGAIANLAAAINAGDTAALRAALEVGQASPVAEVELRAPDLPRLLALALPHYRRLRAFAEAGDAQSALQQLDRFRVLCAVREGRDGVLETNRAIEDALAPIRRGRVQPGNLSAVRIYAGLPILVLRNDTRARLFNGDVGVVVQTAEGLRAAFAATPEDAAQTADAARLAQTTDESDSSCAVRLLPIARLPTFEPVYAMTIHKSQGSEFDTVAVVLPRAPSANEQRLLSRELLYTAVTRTRFRVHLFSPIAALEAAIGAPAQRASGLRQALWQTSAAAALSADRR